MYKYLLIGLILMLQGCAFSASPTLRKEGLSSYHNLVATDSKLRVIASSTPGFLSTTGLVDPHDIICTEPSPDVATTIANSFGVGASILGQGSASLSAQQVEGLVQLGERTAAIQLLRDKMYQTCIAYANGAISGTTYSLLMSRLDDSIVTLSLADGAAGAFGRKLAGIGGEASAKADVSLTTLPGTLSTLDDQSKKLAAANKKVDADAAALQSHKATQPASGKEEEYRNDTATLETNLANAKAERDALLQLMQNTAKSATEATGKISSLQAGGEITPSPNAEILQAMQAEFLLKDIGRDLIYACMVELGLRGAPETEKGMNELTNLLQRMFTQATNPADQETYGINYAGAVNRGRNTLLTGFCKGNLLDLVNKASDQLNSYRRLRTTMRLSASAQDKALFIDAINLCKNEFKDDAPRQQACLDQVVPLNTTQQPSAAKSPAKKGKQSHPKSQSPKTAPQKKSDPKTGFLDNTDNSANPYFAPKARKALRLAFFD